METTIAKGRNPILFLDLETFSGDKPSLDSIKAPSNYKDPDKIKAYKEENLDAIWRKQALNSLKGKIIAIGYAFNDEPAEVMFSEDEEFLLMEFDELITDPYSKLCGHNILRFDIPFLLHRCWKYDLSNLQSILPTDKFDRRSMVIDTLTIFSATNFGSDSWYSLDDIASFFGLPNKESSGSEIHDLWLNKEYDKIIEHCKFDVELTREIYKRTL